MAVKSEPCAVCAQVLLPPPEARTYKGTRITPLGQSLDVFKQTAQTCFICNLVWNATEQHPIAWETAQFDDWKGLEYHIEDVCQEELDSAPTEIQISVFYHSPLTDDHSEVETCGIDTLFSLRILERSTASESTLSLAKSWYLHCSEGHRECASTQDRWLPTRLLDVGEHGNHEWKLIIPAEDMPQHVEYSPYMTLSYRWGPNHDFLLLSETVLGFRSGQAIREMPQTFQDLITVAHYFGIRYVWIDCLCIMQDSAEDWESEAALMAEVYSHSACNIAAVDGKSPRDGLFRDRDPDQLRHRTMPSSICSAEVTDYYVTRMEYFQRQLDPGTLMERGWVLQEWFLAPRMLYYASRQILWECHQPIAKCEAFRHAIPYEYTLKRSRYDLKTVQRDMDEEYGLLTAEEANTWVRLVGRYSRCDLTHPSDKLAAFAGVAKLFLRASGDSYLAGIWKSRILHELTWVVVPPKARPSCGYRAPSWSWASVDGPIDMRSPKPLHKAEYWVEFIDASVESIGKDATVGVVAGLLTLSGTVLSCRYKRAGDFEITLSAEEFPAGTTPPISVWIDTLDDHLAELGQVHILPFKKERSRKRNAARDGFDVVTETTGLLLEPIDADTRDPKE
ncbi:heterokaryon incompatibility protein [Colletotrichum kahawae]|uniref:Heterokaryon incompatibility protein n=1 Tax=Colletotrichum kahawae TaxID=34407 RepID=A0AAE0D5E8_COLKA|nr:heterokaryon incompatibility protein [Colletotrichum kahawae]